MRKWIVLPLLAAITVPVSLVVIATPAQSHGYVSSPPSRQAMCAQRRVPNCGDIIYEPQSVEAPKGSMQCNGSGGRFAVLNDNSRNWPTTSVGNNVAFRWVLTARHSTRDWEYFVGGTRIAFFSDGGRQPPATVTHNVSLGGRTGRVTVLARWNIADTGMAFYACVDLQVGGGGGPNPPNPPTNPPNPPTNPPTNPPNPPTNPPTTPPTGGTWAAGTSYQVGAVVTYGGRSYRCRMAHTALPGWEPPNTPALWNLA